MIIRAANIDDIAAIAAVAAGSYAQAFATILQAEVLAARDAAFFAARFAESWPRLQVATCNAIIGFSLVTDRHLDMLFVTPRAHGSGAGTALLAEAVGRGTSSLECFRDNHAARRFYERHGWRATRAYQRMFAGQARDFVFYERP